MANERISVDKANHVATLTLNRPEKHNAFDGVALQEFGQCMDELSKDEDTRAIIITGAGKSFCAGSDTAYISQIPPSRHSSSILVWLLKWGSVIPCHGSPPYPSLLNF